LSKKKTFLIDRFCDKFYHVDHFVCENCGKTLGVQGVDFLKKKIEGSDEWKAFCCDC
jgi:Fe2+ or Zn2+ uptake regulation protein